jgi:regulator of protease activity HflC (stomatin/prohibitin superfamily)
MSDPNLAATSPAPTAQPSPSPRFWARLRGRIRRLAACVHRHSLVVYIVTLSLLLVLIVLAPRIFIVIPAGHIGVLWRPFLGGTVTDRHYKEGLRIIPPWDEMVIYDARLQKTARMYDTISSNGLSMQVEIAVRFRLDRDSAGLMHKLIGVNYPEILVYPEIGSHARELIAGYTPEQLYTETRAFIQAEILERMVTQLGSSLVSQNVRGKMLHVEDVLIRSVVLPTRVAEAIERKAEQQQVMLEYDFRIAREEKEAERKRIEAAGVRDFQAIVAGTITDSYLRLRGIEATTSLAESPNSKIVIIGGKDGLPVILNPEGGLSQPAPAAAGNKAQNAASTTAPSRANAPGASALSAGAPSASAPATASPATTAAPAATAAPSTTAAPAPRAPMAPRGPSAEPPPRD